MVQIKQTGKIVVNGELTLTEINGEILKVAVFTKTLIPTIRIQMISAESETLIDDSLNSEITLFYPKHTIPISQEQTHVENYYVFSNAKIIISGIGDGEIIDNIKIYYK